MVCVPRAGDGLPAYGLTVAFAVLVYPATLRHYGTLLLLPVAALWCECAHFPGGAAVVVAFISGLVGLAGAGGDAVFGTAILVWAALAILNARIPRVS